jgi:hypothetical protein
MIEDWDLWTVTINALGYSTSAFVSGVVTDALGQALESTPGTPVPLAYFVFFVFLPVTGFFSDTTEMLVRGLIFTFCVLIFSFYIFNDLGEVAAAVFAFVIGLLISLRNE